MMLATLANLLPRRRWPVFLVTPATLLIVSWWPAAGPVRISEEFDRVAPEVVDLVVQMARENPHWGYLRIVGECRKLDVKVSTSSVRRDPAPPRTWARHPDGAGRAELPEYLAELLGRYMLTCHVRATMTDSIPPHCQPCEAAKSRLPASVIRGPQPPLDGHAILGDD
jgi:hypothetical protein